MRDTLALALVRAELCRVRATEHSPVRGTRWHSRSGAIIERMLRSIRAASRSLINGTHARRHAASENVPPPA